MLVFEIYNKSTQLVEVILYFESIALSADPVIGFGN